MHDFREIMHALLANTSHVNFIQKIWRALLVVKVIFCIAHVFLHYIYKIDFTRNDFQHDAE